MELAFVIWAVGTLPTLAGMVCVATFVLMIAAGLAWSITSLFAKIEKKEDDVKECQAVANMAGKVFLWVLPLWFVFMLVPDKSTSYQMLAAYGVQKTVENPKAQGDCHPMFVRPSIQAALTFKYQPRLVDGKPTSVSNVKNTFQYRIES